MSSERLWDINQLLTNYPAFKHWGIRWKIRHRTIPLVRLGRRIYFDPVEIEKWIEMNKIQPKD